MLKDILTVGSVQMKGLDRNIVPLTIRYTPPKGQAGHILLFGTQRPVTTISSPV